MKNVERRLRRLESKIPAMALVEDRQKSDAIVKFVNDFHDIETRLQRELAEHGRPAVVRRVLEDGSELERIALLSHLGHCKDVLMLLMALHQQDDADELLIWWRKAAPLTLRRLLGENIAPAAPFDFRSPEFEGVTSNVEALRVFDRLRAKLERDHRLRSTKSTATAAQ